jgi:hypothetical protein
MAGLKTQTTTGTATITFGKPRLENIKDLFPFKKVFAEHVLGIFAVAVSKKSSSLCRV